MSSWARIFRSSFIMMNICMRGEVLRNSLLIIFLPLTLSSIYIIGSSAITNEMGFVASNIYHGQLGHGCILGGVVYQELLDVGAIPIYLVENVNDFLSLYSCRATYIRRGVDGALISVDLWRNLSINTIQIPIPQGIHNASVIGFIDCTYLHGRFIVLNSSIAHEVTKLCPRPSTRFEIVSSFGKSFSRIMFLLSFLSLIPFAIASPLAFSRAVDSISREICITRAQGLGLGELRYSLLLSLTILILISSIYGISTGIVLAHGALWALRFFRVSIFSRPLPISTLLLFTGIYDILILLSAILVIYSRVGRSEDIC